MTTLSKMLLAAPALMLATVAQAQTGGVAVADPDAAVANSTAYTTARGQIETTYKAQIEQAQTRGQAIEAELRTLATQFQAAQKAPGANPTSLQTQYNAIQAKQQAGQQEIARITEPAQRAQTYVVEQIRAREGEAIQNVVKAKSLGLVVTPQAVLAAQPTADITAAITAELNRLVPSVGITPPAGWQPAGQGQAAAAPAGATPAPATPAPTGRRNTGGR